MTAELSQDNHEPAYLCGRLFAVLEHAQKLTIGESGKAGKEDKKSFAGISSRFFGTASSAPGTVFPQLMKLYRNHHKKLERDNPKAAYGIDEEITSIVENISTDGFPGILSLEKQGLFHIGYYHQKAAERRARREAKERKAKTKEAQEATSKNEKEGQ